MLERLTDLAERIAAAAARRGAWEQADALGAVLSVLAADYPPLDGPTADPPAAGQGATRDRLDEVVEVFGLDPLDALLLLCACAPGLDANMGLACGLLRGLPGVAATSVGLALELAGIGGADATGFDRLAPGAPLRRHRLLEVTGTDPWPARVLQPADPVVAALAGARPADPLITPLLCDPAPLELPGGEQLARAVGSGLPLVWVRADPRAAGGALATGALDSLGLRWLAVDARRIPPGQEPADVMAAAGRMAGLLGCALVVVGAEALGEGPSAAAALTELAGAAVPVIAVGRCAWNGDWLPHAPLQVDAAPLTAGLRETLWRDGGLGELIGQDDELRKTLLALRMSPDEVAETARYAHALAAARGERPDVATVRAAVRRIGGSHGRRDDRVEVSAADAGAGPTFDDLVLPEHVLDSLHRLVDWGRHRDEVRAFGPLRRGRGIAALFAGNPGTGKTLAAHVVAEELSVELFQVELSAIVDKYIGETEKHLERVFEAAEALDVVLFFDEADALFGSRSEVHDARDRYANQEIAYLLQRMERFEGITILATNLRGNLDRAFSRRMSFIVNFPDPDVPTRRRLWEHHLALLPELDAADPVDVGYLAEQAELAGGDIRNIVLAAAYDAASAGRPVGMRGVRAATLREYRKLGRVLPEHGFSPASGG